jgi:3-deoxy-D-manno-octulosonic-acid transferase
MERLTFRYVCYNPNNTVDVCYNPNNTVDVCWGCLLDKQGYPYTMGILFWLLQGGLLLGVLLTLPAWLLLLWQVPKTRAGFWQKCGFFSHQQQQWIKQWQTQYRDTDVKTVWVHAVSVGEFLAVKPFIIQLLARKVAVIVSTTTQTGQQLAREAFADHALVCYFPFDVVWSVDAFITRLKPDAVLIMETELWPTFLHRVSKRFGIPVFLINGRISNRSFARYQRIKSFMMQPLLQCFKGLYMQSSQDAERILTLGATPERVNIAGNLKLDVPLKNEVCPSSELAKAWFFNTNVPILTFASTHAGEERLLIEQVCLPLWQQFPQLKVVLAPRHPERTTEVRELLAQYQVPYQQRSLLLPAVGLENNGLTVMPSLLLVDTIGELKTILGMSTVAVVAGSFLSTLGGHNLLEPIAMQVPTVFGAYTSNFSEITRLVLAAEAGIQVASVSALLPVLQQLLTDDEQRHRLVAAGNGFLAQHQGNTTRLLESILTQL